MSFREFTANIESTRDYKETKLDEITISNIIAYLREINAGIGSEKGFSFVVLEKGDEVYKDLEGVGGYSGIMIKSPHYIALTILKEDQQSEFYGAYYMQSIVKKLYEMELGSCWISIRDISNDIKTRLLNSSEGTTNYLLAFGMPDEKAMKQKSPKVTVSSAGSAYKQDPYGTVVSEAAPSDGARYSLGEIVYLHTWGRQASYEELESRGMTDIFFYVRNAPSYKNLQPCRLILQEGETELAVVNPEDVISYTDAGIMLYTLEGLAKDMGIPSQWSFIQDESQNKDYRIVARIKL